MSHAFFILQSPTWDGGINLFTVNFKLSLITALFALLCAATSCKAPSYAIGMSQKDFLSHSHPTLVKATASESIYRVTKHHGIYSDQNTFYYFRNGSLVQIDQGVRTPDIIVQHK